MDKPIDVGQGMILIIEVAMGIIQVVIKGMGGQIIAITEGEKLEVTMMIEIGAGHMKENRDRRYSRSIGNSRSRSGSRATTNRERIRCFECREYDHFVRDCPTRKARREIEQRQQMFNVDEDQTVLQSPLMDTDQDKQTITQVETRDNLNI